MLREKAYQVLEVVIAAKGFVSAALTPQPVAALAWAGVCVLLPLLTNPKQQYEDATEGLLRIPLLIRRYEVLESVYRHREGEGSRLREDFTEQVKKLYSCILQFQARAVCQWSRSTIQQYTRDVFKADDWAKLTREIQHLDKSCEDIARAMDGSTLSHILDFQRQQLSHSIESYRERLSGMEKKEERDCLQVLGYSDYLKHKNRNPLRVPETCQWFLRHEKFLHWRDGEKEASKLLWVSADPGCGKSVLARTLIDENLLFEPEQTFPVISYFFFKDGLLDQQGSARCISALLHQIFSQQPKLIKHALFEYRAVGKEIAIRFEKLWNILCAVGSDPDSCDIICVVDALDECEQGSRFDIIDSLKELYDGQTSNENLRLKFLVTSRPYENIQRRFRSLTNVFPTIHMEGEQESEAISSEINLVIKAAVPEIAIELDLSPQVAQDLLKRLLSISNRTYLWLHLILRQIRNTLGATTSKKIARVLQDLPETVDAAYGAILAKSDNIGLARRLLHITVGATKDLTISEMNVALNIKLGMHSINDLDLEDDNKFEITVRNICGLFISVVDSRIFLIHQTAREYLIASEATSAVGAWKHSLVPSSSQSILAECCLIYLHFTAFAKRRPRVTSRLRDARLEFVDQNGRTLPEDEIREIRSPPEAERYPFLSYAALNWVQHFKGGIQGRELTDLASKLCDPESPYFLAWFNTFQAYEQSLPPTFHLECTCQMVLSVFDLHNLIQICFWAAP
ncbi:hypothetical protein BDZ45DRAFT_590819 [Acephala macrosclerotiorum]|nr:hypothetical protein BDZ45DRAFT_590819 [Acephala macrosclerotiorum]